MHLRNTPEAYGPLTKTLHWLTAFLVITLLAIGLSMDGIASLALKLKVYGLHKSFGITVLILAVARISWHLFSRPPGLIPCLKRWEALLAKSMHFFLYAALIGMPLSGWLMSSAAGRPVVFFGLLTLPDLVEQNQDLRACFGTTHAFLGYTLIVAIAGHAGAALQHHFVKKDATLRRMLPGKREA